jgi:hypothetical protein
MANWFLIQEGKEHGPVQSGRLRELVATGQLCPTDLVRRDDMAKYCRADQIKGLFPSSASAVATSNQQPDAQPRQHGDRNSVHTQQPSADLAPPSRATPRWKQILFGLWRTTADASRLTALQVEKTKLHSITLQRAFAALGRHLDDASTSAPSGEEFSMLRTQIRDLKARIEATRSVAANQPASQGVLDKAKGMARATADADNRKKLEMQLAGVLADLGKAAFERLGEAAGPVEILRPIVEGSSRAKQIEDEQGKLGGASRGRLVTPRRVAFAGIAFVCLAICAGIGSLIDPQRKPEDLTVDFFPHKNGTVQRRLTSLYISEGGEIESVKEYTHQIDRISVKWISQKAVSGKMERSLPLPAAKIKHLRIQDGFIETGNENEITKKIVWSPIIKIGAKAGDSWHREVVPGLTESYRVKEFRMFESTALGKIWSATVEMTSSAKVAAGPPNVLLIETDYGIGVGPILTKSWRFENEKKVLNWNEVLLPTK